jgi:DDE superfamily endonuclease
MPCESLEPAKAALTRPPTRRSRNRALAQRLLVIHQKGVQAQLQRILLTEESGFSPLPIVVRIDAPVGHIVILWACWTHDHLPAVSAVWSEGPLPFHCQDHPIHSGNVVTVLEHLLCEVLGRMIIIWDGSPIHRSHTIRDFLTNGVSQRLHREHLLAYVPDLYPDEDDWQQLKGIERRNLCCLHLPPLRHELCHTVRRSQRNHV